MFKEELINPITKREKGQCPLCGSTLTVCSQVTEWSKLNASGLTIDIKTDTICSAGICTNCGSTYYDEYTSEVEDEPVLCQDKFAFTVVKDLKIYKWLKKEFPQTTPEPRLYSGLSYKDNPFSK